MKGRVLGLVGGCSLLLLFVTQASAADPPKPPPPAELVPRVRPTTRSFYGWEILATGEVGGVLAAAGVLLPDTPLGSAPATVAFITGMPLFVLGGPAVHWTHGYFGKGLVSFGGNLVLPFIGGFAGQALRCNEANAPLDCGSRGFLTGIVVAAMITPVIDALVLGWEDVPVDDAILRSSFRLTRRRSTPTLAITPWWYIGENGPWRVGLSGRF